MFLPGEAGPEVARLVCCWFGMHVTVVVINLVLNLRFNTKHFSLQKSYKLIENKKHLLTFSYHDITYIILSFFNQIVS